MHIHVFKTLIDAVFQCDIGSQSTFIKFDDFFAYIEPLIKGYRFQNKFQDA